jgi:PPOX class probable FMN-dependent enzyme
MSITRSSTINAQYIVGHVSELDEMYGPALERSVRKQMDHLDGHCRAFIARSPMVVIGTRYEGFADTSPRGDVAGFVRVVDDHTLIIPDRRGNNRLDSLRNIVQNPAVGLLFLIPGINETFRVNGDAVLSRDPELTASFAVEGKQPRTVIVVTVRHCSDSKGSVHPLQPRPGSCGPVESCEVRGARLCAYIRNHARRAYRWFCRSSSGGRGS